MPIQLPSFLRNFFGGGRVPDGQVKRSVFGIGTSEVYSPIEQQTALTKGFNANTAVYSIVKRYAKKAASIPIYLENKATEEPFEDTHPLMVLLRRPNEHQSQAVFFKLVFGGYKIFGESFIWLNRGDEDFGVDNTGQIYERTSQQYLKMPVLEMYAIPAYQMVILPSKEDPNEIAGYQLRNMPSVKFRKEDILHWMDINLDWDEFARPQLRGMSPLKPGFKTLAADNSAIDSMVRMFQNDGAKGAIVNKNTGKLSPQQETAVRGVIDEKINNKEVKNAIAALEGDWQYLDFGLTSVDMETLKGREFIYKEFCFLFGVPYEFFDSQTTYANKEQAARGWISNEIMPDCKELTGELERGLFPAFGITPQTAAISANFDGLPEMQEDRKTQIEWMSKAPLSPNEIRKELGYETDPDPLMDEVWMPPNLVPMSERIDPELQAEMDKITNDNTGAGDGEIPERD